MFGKSLRFGRLFGISLTASWSLLLLVVVMSIYLAISSGSFLAGLIIGPLMMVLLFASVLAHEMGHSLVAQRLGVRIKEIELHFFGGAAKMLSMPRSPRDEILIAAAGPAVSFALAGFFWLISQASTSTLGLAGYLTSINLMLGAFNLIPALPTDGGRILRAALAYRYSPFEATKVAVKVARVATIGLGMYFLVTWNLFGLVLTFFLWTLGSQELRMAQALHAMGRSPYDAATPGAASWKGQPTTPSVEVFDRQGRLLGVARGGAEQVTVTHSPIPETQPIGPSWRSVSSPFQPYQVRQHVVVRGSDGRLWVVSQS